jgi:hypothetical protein
MLMRCRYRWTCTVKEALYLVLYLLLVGIANPYGTFVLDLATSQQTLRE